MILAISKYKLHPFLAIMGVAVVLGLLAGIPIITVTHADGTTTTGIAGIIGEGFSAIFTGIGLVIILGALIGAMLEITGGAFKIADMIIKMLSKRSPTLSIIIMGWIVSVPVFCDSGFVIINPVRKSVVKRTACSGVATAVGLGGGLYTSHVARAAYARPSGGLQRPWPWRESAAGNSGCYNSFYSFADSRVFLVGVPGQQDQVQGRP